jgi:hypothetical protein
VSVLLSADVGVVAGRGQQRCRKFDPRYDLHATTRGGWPQCARERKRLRIDKGPLGRSAPPSNGTGREPRLLNRLGNECETTVGGSKSANDISGGPYGSRTRLFRLKSGPYASDINAHFDSSRNVRDMVDQQVRCESKWSPLRTCQSVWLPTLFHPFCPQTGRSELRTPRCAGGLRKLSRVGSKKIGNGGAGLQIQPNSRPGPG